MSSSRRALLVHGSRPIQLLLEPGQVPSNALAPGCFHHPARSGGCRGAASRPQRCRRLPGTWRWQQVHKQGGGSQTRAFCILWGLTGLLGAPEGNSKGLSGCTPGGGCAEQRVCVSPFLGNHPPECAGENPRALIAPHEMRNGAVAPSPFRQGFVVVNPLLGQRWGCVRPNWPFAREQPRCCLAVR